LFCRCARWVQLCRRDDLRGWSSQYLYTNCWLCEKHFEPSQFYNKVDRNRLLPYAEPSIFDVPNPPSRLQSARRVLKRKLPMPDSDTSKCRKSGFLTWLCYFSCVGNSCIHYRPLSKFAWWCWRVHSCWLAVVGLYRMKKLTIIVVNNWCEESWVLCCGQIQVPSQTFHLMTNATLHLYLQLREQQNCLVCHGQRCNLSILLTLPLTLTVTRHVSAVSVRIVTFGTAKLRIGTALSVILGCCVSKTLWKKYEYQFGVFDKS